MTEWEMLATDISKATGQLFQIQQKRMVGGGCINRAAIISNGVQGYFVKLNTPERLAMFEAEAAGLTTLAAAHAIRVPIPLCTGLTDQQSYLVMELLDLNGRLDGVQAGQQLAQLHRVTAQFYGWERDNTIGATPQCNRINSDWVALWDECRLGYQLKLAASNGYNGLLQTSGERLRVKLAGLIGHRPVASLLHGDLWGGNIGATSKQQPVIFDPAVYYGDREVDLAMTELFGGFGADFQAAYREAWPLDSGYSIRKILYNLYHILNHLNLFGGGYLRQAQMMIDRLLSEIN